MSAAADPRLGGVRPNLLQILGVQRKEDVVTNLLVHAFNSDEQARIALLGALELPGTPLWRSARAHTRVAVDAGVPDIIIAARHGSDAALAIVEHKIDADEGDVQTVRYAEEACRNQLVAMDALGLRGSVPEVAYRFLTLFPDQQPASPHFRAVTHQRLLEHAWPVPTPGSWVGDLVEAWLDLIREFYRPVAVDEGQPIGSALRAEGGLGRSYLVFRDLMRSVQVQEGIKLRSIWRQSAQGRNLYLAQFGREEWSVGGIEAGVSPRRLAPGANHDIHFEVQWDAVSGRLGVFLHYETRPYLPRRELAKLSAEDQGSYRAFRDQFAGRFKAHAPSFVRITNYLNQLAVVEEPVVSLGFAAVAKRLTDWLAELGRAVDKSLRDPQA